MKGEAVATATICRRPTCTPRYTFGRASYNIPGRRDGKFCMYYVCTKVSEIIAVIPGRFMMRSTRTIQKGQSGTDPNSIFICVLWDMAVGEKHMTGSISRKKKIFTLEYWEEGRQIRDIKI